MQTTNVDVASSALTEMQGRVAEKKKNPLVFHAQNNDFAVFGGAGDDDFDSDDSDKAMFKETTKEMDWGVRGRFRRQGTVPKIINAHPEVRNTNTRTFSEYDSVHRQHSKVMGTLAVLSILLTVCMLEVQWNNGTGVYTSSTAGQVLKAIVSFITLLMLVALYRFYRFLVDLDSAEQYPYIRRRMPMIKSPRCIFFVIESLVILVHAPPYMNFTTTIGGNKADQFVEDQLSLVVLFRFYLLVRCIRDWSNLYKWRKWILQSGRMQYGFPKVNAFFTLKSHFYSSPWIFTIACVVMSIIFFAYCVYVCERQLNPGLFSWKNTVYFMCVTMTTVGYGDISPVTVRSGEAPVTFVDHRQRLLSFVAPQLVHS
jgi:hypothetical protein